MSQIKKKSCKIHKDLRNLTPNSGECGIFSNLMNKKMIRRYIFLFLQICIFSVSGLMAQGSGKELTLLDINTIPDVVLQEELYPLHFDILNTGTVTLIPNEAVTLRMSVNQDSHTELGSVVLSSPLYPGDTLHLDFPGYQFEAFRFSGGVGNDIVIWPTIVNDPTQFDSLIKTVIYINAAAFKVNNNLVGGINNIISYNTSYIVSVKTENVGLDENVNEIQFFTQLDDLDPRLIGVLDESLDVGEIGQTEVESFSIADLYPDFVYDQSVHYLTIWAKESNKENTVSKAVYQIISSPLPVELLNFEASIVPESNRINVGWQTAFESNNKDFIIQKYNDEKKAFEEISVVPSKGNGVTNQQYSIIDDSPLSGINRYRIAQLDYDGTIRALATTFADYHIPQSFRVQSVYPNPVKDKLSFALFNSVMESIYIRIINTDGKVIYEGKLSDKTGTVICSLNTEALTEGIYFYKIYNPVLSIYGKFIKY